MREAPVACALTSDRPLDVDPTLMLEVLGPDAAAGVGDLEHGDAGLAHDPQAYRAAGLGVAKRVLATIWANRPGSPEISAGTSSGSSATPHRRSSRPSARPPRRRPRPGPPPLIEQEPGPLGSREPVEVVEEPRQPQGLGAHRLEVRAGVREHPVLRSPGPRQQPTDRWRPPFPSPRSVIVQVLQTWSPQWTRRNTSRLA